MNLKVAAMDAERANQATGVPSEAREISGAASSAHGSRPTPTTVSSSLSRLQQAQTPVAKVLRMGKGNAQEDSYSKNSEVQSYVNKLMQRSLSDALERVALPSDGGPVSVADLGSSSGPNTITNVAFIVEKLRRRMPEDAEFTAYFNDLPSNDFNNLFQLLSNDERTKNFFAAGVSGSCYERLFAQSSVHVFFSSNTVHWLSKVPDEVMDKDSPAYNAGHTWIYHSRSAVAKAYQQQALLDMKSFLQARATELVPGGLLFFVCNGRTTTEANKHGLNDNMYGFVEDLNKVWSELIAEGLLTEQQRDTFNIPVYLRNLEDVREAIASCDSGSEFDVLTTQLHVVDLTPGMIFGTTDPTLLAKKCLGAWKAVMNPLIEAHVGNKLAEVIWERYSNVLQKRISSRGLKSMGPICIIGVIRK